MYKILKRSGFNGVVTLLNTETNGSMQIGRMMDSIRLILEEEGYKFGVEEDGGLLYSDPWDLEISVDAKKKIEVLGMTMHKPPKRTRKVSEIIQKVKENTEEESKSKTVNALDVLLGLADFE